MRFRLRLLRRRVARPKFAGFSFDLSEMAVDARVLVYLHGELIRGDYVTLRTRKVRLVQLDPQVGPVVSQTAPFDCEVRIEIPGIKTHYPNSEDERDWFPGQLV